MCQVNEVDAILYQLPPPTPKQLDAITESLDKVDSEFGISEEEKETRLKIVQRLEGTLQEKIPGNWLCIHFFFLNDL